MERLLWSHHNVTGDQLKFGYFIISCLSLLVHAYISSCLMKQRFYQILSVHDSVVPAPWGFLMKSYNNVTSQHGLITWSDQRFVTDSQNRQKKPYHSPLPFGYSKVCSKASGLNMDRNHPIYETPLRYVNRFNSDSSELVWKKQVSVECENTLVEKINGISVNLYDMYRTRKEAIDMVTKRVNQLISAVRNIKRGRWRAFKKSLTLPKRLRKPRAFGKVFSETWLEYSYGWSPLLSDIFHILDKTFEPPKMQVKARNKYVHTSSKTGESTERYKGRGTEELICTYSNTMQVDISVDIPALQAASQYGLLNPLAVAWEAVPFSFVVDWFYPVGTYLEQLNNYAGLKFSNFYETRNITSTRILDVSVQFYAYGPWSSTQQAIVFRKSKERLKKNGSPSFSIVSSDAPLTSSINRSMNAIALFGALFLEKRR